MILRRLKLYLYSFLEKIILFIKGVKNKSFVEWPRNIKGGKYIYLGKHVCIHGGARIECYNQFSNMRYNPYLLIGDGVIIGYDAALLVTDHVFIGAKTILAQNVLITSENHGMNLEDSLPYYAQPLTSKAVYIGEGCWIAQNVSIMPGVTIGDKCIIGANSVVNKDIPAYSIAVGIPAKVVKHWNFDTHKWEK